MSKLFHKNMSNIELGYAYFAALDGKSKEEQAEIEKEYQAILPAWIEQQMKEVAEGWMD